MTLTLTDISMRVFFPSQMFTRDINSCTGGATLPAKRPLQKDNPIKNEDTKNVPPVPFCDVSKKRKEKKNEIVTLER